jgi:flagellar hook-associated protein 1 FlgK
MSSPFYGLDIGASALRAAQQMLDTAAHNVANASTPGYSRQVVSLVESAPYTYPAFNRSGLPGQVGSGVTVAAITRVRDNFLDLQVQAQTALKGEWDTRQQELAKVESIFPEPSDSSLGNSLSKYWSAWQDVATDPTSTAARTALTEQAASLAMEMNRDSTQLGMIATGIDSQVSQQILTVNDLAKQIAGLNGQIQRVTVTGDHANDLLDQREQLLEKLSAIVPSTTMTQPDGTLTVLVGGTDLVNGVSSRQLVSQTDPSNGHITPTWADGGAVALPSGSMKSLLNVRDVDLASYRSQLDSLAKGVADATNAIHQRGVDANGNAGQAIFTYHAGNVAGTLAVNTAVAADPSLVAASASPSTPGDGSVAGLIADLGNAKSYSAGVAGTDIVGGMDLTSGTTARLMTISTDAAVGQTYTFSGSGTSLTLAGADGSTQTINVADMAIGGNQTLNFDQLGVKLTVNSGATTKSAADLVTDFTAPGHNTVVVASLYSPSQTTTDFYAGLIGKIGTASAQSAEMSTNQQLVVDQLTTRVQEVSGVSLDEEATDMIRFQHAYQAAARVITTMDEMLNTLINGTGLVGRG